MHSRTRPAASSPPSKPVTTKHWSNFASPNATSHPSSFALANKLERSADFPVRSKAAAIALFNKRVVLTGNQRLESPQALRPPVEITLVAKTDSTNLRMAYAADQVIFNWELDLDQLRVDGGPANGLHQRGKGRIPINKYVTVKWLVSPTNQAIYVDGQLRLEHAGDYSEINRRAVVFPAAGSTITVKSFKVQRVTQFSADKIER